MTTEVNLYLERREPSNAGGFLGRLLINEIDLPPQPQPGAIALQLEFFADPGMESDPPAHWVALSAAIRTTTLPAQSIGSIVIEHTQRPPFPPLPMNRQTSVQWLWQLFPADIENVERSRQMGPDPATPLSFSITVNGIVDTPPGVLGVNGMNQIRIETSHWQRLLKSVGYTIPPSGIAALSNTVLSDVTWAEAAQRLAQARSHLRRGETYPALTECLRQLEAFVTSPYKSDSWRSALATMPEQKRSGVASWMAGLAAYLNKVGHHRDRGERDQEGDLAIMPADHWEAELAVASTQMAVAYLLRTKNQHPE